MIDFDGELAYTESYFTAWHQLAADKAGSGVFAAHKVGVCEDVHIGGRYINWLERRNGVWRISKHMTIVEWGTLGPDR